MAVARLGGSAVASSVMGDDAIAVFEEEQHLRVPVIGRQRPTMAEDDGLSFAPVLIIDVDVGSVLRSDCNVGHGNLSLFSVHKKFVSASDRGQRSGNTTLRHPSQPYGQRSRFHSRHTMMNALETTATTPGARRKQFFI